MKRVYAGIQRFRSKVFPKQRKHFEALEAGQKPELLLITCSDSRIDPALLTQTEPGELFVVRNAGNIVPPYGEGSGAEAATVQFGIERAPRSSAASRWRAWTTSSRARSAPTC